MPVTVLKSVTGFFLIPYSAKMWLMSTFENEISKLIFFVSTLLDWYTGTKMQNRILKSVIFIRKICQKNVCSIC